MIRVQVNAGDFLKSILNVGDFTRKFKCNHYFINAGDSIARHVMQKIFYIDFSHCKERQSLVIPFIADIRNDYIYYNLLSFKLPSGFRFIYLIFGSSH